MKLKYEIVGAIVLSVMLTGIGQFYIFKSVQGNQAEQVTSFEVSKELVVMAYELQRTYQNHIQSWKNILLRGHLPDQYHAYLSEFYAYDRLFKRQIGELRERFEEQSQAADTLTEVARIHASTSKGYRQTLEQYAQAEQTPQDLASRFVVEERSIINHLDEMTTEIVDAQLSQLVDINQRNSSVLNTTLIFSVVIGITGVTLLYALVVFRIIRPIDKTVDVANQIKEGETNLRLPALGSAEFASFTESFNQMLDALE